MNNSILILLTIFFIHVEFVSAQQFQVSHQTITFNDPLRSGGFGSGAGSGRQIQCEVYYPSLTSGEQQTIAPGEFPFVVFAHGLTTPIESYANYWETLVPFGYIFIVPRTEGTTLPIHLDFGLDINQIGSKMVAQASNSASPFYQSWNGKSAIIGHDMGAGCAILGGKSNSFVYNALVSIAPTETSPSAVATSVNIEFPSLFVSGTGDSITNRITTLLPMYNGLLSECRSLVDVIGGGHCGFASNAISCALNETVSNSSVSISENLQQTILFDYLKPWLNYFTKDICNGWIDFSELSSSDFRTDAQSTCLISLPSKPVISQFNDVLSTDLIAPVQWFFNGHILSGQTANSLSITPTGIGNYQVASLDTSGCTLFSEPFMVTEIILGIDDLNGKSKISLFPNPANEFVVVRSLNSELISIELLNLRGEIVSKYSEKKDHHKLDVSQLSAGMYLIRVNSKEVLKLSVY